MVENVAGDKIVSTSERGSQGHISLSDAGVMAVRTARASAPPRRWILRRRMLFDVLNDHEDEDTYTVVVGFRPEGDFEGTPGQEQFKFSKTGRFQGREVLSHPRSTKRFRIKRKTVAIGIVAIFVSIGFAIMVMVLISGRTTCASFYCAQDSALSQTYSVTGGNSITDWDFDTAVYIDRLEGFTTRSLTVGG